MYQYSLYGCTISSTMEFPQLVVANTKNESDVVILDGGIPSEVLEEAEKNYYEIDDKVSWFQNHTGVFYIAKGSVIRYQLKEGANIQYARTYILGYAISMLLLQRDIMTIHCSAIAGEDGAILIAGQSGSGKSTITTSYLKEGYQLMADDIVAVRINEEEKVMACPAFPYQKLCRDAVNREGFQPDELIYIDEDKDKFLVSRKEQFTDHPVKVKAMVMLGVYDGDKVEVEEITGVNKLMAVRENLFLKRLSGEWLGKANLIKTCLEIGSKVPIYVVMRPEKSDTRLELKETLDKILR